MMYLVMAALEMLAMWSTKLPHYSVIIQSWSICGEKQSSISTLPPGSALIGHQGALLEGKKCYFSAICGPIGLKLWGVVGTGHSNLATRWRPYQPPGGATGGSKVLFLSCMWANRVETLVGIGDRP